MKKTIKILYHSRTFATGGARIHIDVIVKNLRKLNHQVCLVEPVSGGRESKKANFLSEFKSKIPSLVSEILEILYNFKSYRDLNKHKGYDFIYERHALFNLAGMWYCKKNNIPFFLEVNSPLTYERSKYGNLFFKGIAKKLEIKVFKSATKIFCVSEHLKKILCSYGIDGNKINVTHNGVDENLILLDSKSRKTNTLIKKYNLEDKIVVGFVGYMLKWHGGENLLKALRDIFEKYDNVVFLLIGGIDYDLKINRSDKSRIKVIENINHDGIYNYIDLFDIGVMTHSNSYGSPMKLVEYMGLGKAVVCANQPAIKELVKDMRTGLIIKSNDYLKIYQALEMLIKNKKLRNKLGENAKKFIFDNKFTWENNAKNIIDSYSDLLKK